MILKMNILVLVASLLLISSLHQANSSSQDYVFTLPDITVEYTFDNDEIVKLKAYKTRSNDQIIKGNERENFGQLEWVSLGIPRLVSTVSTAASTSSKHSSAKYTNNKMALFHWSSNKHTFYTFISMLDMNERSLLQKRIALKYNISVGIEQIVSLPLNELKCTINLRCSKNGVRALSSHQLSSTKLVQVTGKIENFNRSPLRLEFELDKPLEPHVDCIERNFFSDIRDKLDHTLKCEASQRSQTGMSNVLIIKGDQLSKLGLLNEIFGDADFKYLTRSQLDTLTSDIHSRLNIYEEYGINMDILRDDFVDEILRQTARSTFENVPFGEALKSLSPYSIQNDMKPDEIFSELSDVLQVKNYANKSHLIVNEENFERFMEKTRREEGGGGGGSFMGIGAEASYNVARENQNENEKSKKTLDEQLKEINNAETSHVVFERKGKKIVPKSLKVSKVSRAKFAKSFAFKKEVKVLNEAKFNEKFTLHTLSSLKNSKPTEKLIKYDDGRVYRGFVDFNNKKQGQGVLTWANGDKYDGYFKNDKANGYGTWSWSNSGNKYIGEWKENKQSGHGTMYWKDGRTYVGSWHDGKRNGHGVLTWSNLDKYDGKWRNDRMNGVGTKYYKDGRIERGQWSDDEFIQYF